MATAEELLDVAQGVLDAAISGPAALRRATSTAYYALFHLLISEATINWEQTEFRPLLGRVFSHGTMKSACEKVPGVNAKKLKQSPTVPFEQRTPSDHLRVVAETFIQTQERREIADYDMTPQWNRNDAAVQIEQVAEAFRSWNAIRQEPESQRFLVLLMGPKQRSSRA